MQVILQATDDGGFIVYVQSQLPMDETAMNADLPQFAAALPAATRDAQRSTSG